MTSGHPGCESALASLMYNREELVTSTDPEASRRDHLLVTVGHKRRSEEYRCQSRHEVQCLNVKTSGVIEIVQMLSAVIRVILCSLAVMFVRLEANPSHLKHKLTPFFLKLDTSSISPVKTLSYSAFSTRTWGGVETVRCCPFEAFHMEADLFQPSRTCRLQSKTIGATPSYLKLPFLHHFFSFTSNLHSETV